MKRQLPFFIAAALILALQILTSQIAAAQTEANTDNWTQWRGQNRDGVAKNFLARHTVD